MRSQIVYPNQIEEALKIVQAKRLNIGLCHGCFDILHYGHLIHFEDARKNCDFLIVSITPDQFVNKGPNRPIFDVHRRSYALSNIRSIDLVYINDSATAVEPLKKIKPNFYFKGPDYANFKPEDAIAKEISFAKTLGISTIFTTGENHSTTKIVTALGGYY